MQNIDQKQIKGKHNWRDEEQSAHAKENSIRYYREKNSTKKHWLVCFPVTLGVLAYKTLNIWKR